MKNIFVISDTHFGHQNMYQFLRADSTRVRHQFKDATEGDEAMVENWNRVVKPTDKVYHLGDVFINKNARHILRRLNGDKVLIKGNHDIFELKYYTEFFRDIRAYHVLDRMILSHIPIYADGLERFKRNIHGHLHEKIVVDATKKADGRYVCVSVEQINYTPIELSEIRSKL